LINPKCNKHREVENQNENRYSTKHNQLCGMKNQRVKQNQRKKKTTWVVFFVVVVVVFSRGLETSQRWFDFEEKRETQKQ
jgi:hypothetical protein